jgi:phage terminase Nu1 subunit (DNA packaging protein)
MTEKKAEWITQSEAAELLDMSLQAVNQLVRRGVVLSEIVYGKRLVNRASARAYVPRAKRTAKKATTKGKSKSKR